MIRPIDIRLNAAHPELPLSEAFTFTGSPSTVLVRNVPPNCGRWAITSINVAATFPDGSTTTRAAVQSANGVWVATLPATATSGRTASGLRIMADGIDENGEAVTGYILGVADFAVASLGITPAPEPGATNYPMLYFDTAPSVLRKGDVTKIDGVLKFYDGTAWLPFAEIDPSGYVPTSRTINDKPLTDNVSLSGADIPTTAAPNSPTLSNSIQTLTNTTQTLTNTTQTLNDSISTLNDSISTLNNTKASKADATLTPIYSDAPTFSEWTFSDGEAHVISPVIDGVDGWYFRLDNDSPSRPTFNTKEAAETSLVLNFPYIGITATRTRTDIIGYQLGLQSDKPLQPKGDYPTKAQMDAGWWSEWTVTAAPSSFPDPIESVHVVWYTAAEALERELSDGEGWYFESNISAVWGGNDNDASSIAEGGFAATRHRVAAPVPTKPEDIGAATRAANPTAGNLAALDAQGNPTDSGIAKTAVAPLASPAFTGTPTAPTPASGDNSTKIATTAFVQGAIPYTIGTPTVIATASSETVEGETVYYGAATLADRTANTVQVTAALDELRITFPAATSGKVRDFGLRVEIGTGSAALTAPALVPVAPTGETIKIENADGTIPELADGTATAKGVTLLYFSETSSGVFVVKGEQVEEVA